MDYIKGLPLAPHRCRSVPHQLPLATGVCRIAYSLRNFLFNVIFIIVFFLNSRNKVVTFVIKAEKNLLLLLS